MITNEQSAIWGNFWQIVDLSKKLLSDYENLVTEPELARKLPQIETAYIDSIIVHIAKIFTNSKNEPFRLEQFKAICRTEIKKEIEKMEEEYKDITGKIVTNRNKLIAHLDKNFSDLCFSKNEIERMEQDIAKSINSQDTKGIFASMPITSDKSRERYSVRDFRDDLPRINEMIKKLDNIWSRSIPFV